ANGDADAVAHNGILLGQAILDAPAEEDANIVADELVIADDGALGAGTRMQTELGVVFGRAILDKHIVANLPAYAVAVVVAGGNVAYFDAVAVLEKQATPVVAIEVLILRPIAIESEVLDRHVAHVFAGDQWKNGHCDGIAELPKVVPQRPI